jgi:hypothetical protein
MLNRVQRAPGKGLFMQLLFSLNIPDKAVHSEDVEQDNIPTLVRFFNEGNRSSLYQPDTFAYAWCSFLTNSSNDEVFYILLHASSLDWLVPFPALQEQS